MTEEQKNLMQSLYNVRDTAMPLSAEQALKLRELEDAFINEELLPALQAHVMPLMQKLKGDFTLLVEQAAGRGSCRIERPGELPEAAPEEPEEPDEPDEPEEPEATPEGERPKRHRERPNFRFSMVGIKRGELVTFAPTGLRVRVVADNKVEYEGQQYKLSPFVGKFLPDHLRNPKNSYQGSKYFTYKGRTLDDLRPDSKKKRPDPEGPGEG